MSPRSSAKLWGNRYMSSAVDIAPPSSVTHRCQPLRKSAAKQKPRVNYHPAGFIDVTHVIVSGIAEVRHHRHVFRERAAASNCGWIITSHSHRYTQTFHRRTGLLLPI